MVAADGGVPTSTAGGATELRSGLLAQKGVANQIQAFDKALCANTGAPLLAGDVQVWERPAAAYDASRSRPTIRVKGDQLCRLVALDRSDPALADQLGSVHTLELPLGTARWRPSASAHLSAPRATRPEPPGGTGTALAQVGAAAYLGPGCVVTATSPATLRNRQPVTAAVVTGAAAVAGAAAVTTRLPVDTRTVIVALEATVDPDDALSGLILGIDGGEQTGATPTIVVSGTRAHGLFDVRALRGSAAISVTVATDPRWRLAPPSARGPTRRQPHHGSSRSAWRRSSAPSRSHQPDRAPSGIRRRDDPASRNRRDAGLSRCSAQSEPGTPPNHNEPNHHQGWPGGTGRRYVDVTAPRFALAPGELLSTFPPANSVGAFDNRLPQVTFRRRTFRGSGRQAARRMARPTRGSRS